MNTKKIMTAVAASVCTFSCVCAPVCAKTNTIIPAHFYLEGWPEPGYNHVDEDKTFATMDEAINYANTYGMDMYNKYNAYNEWEVLETTDGYVLKWYVLGATTNVTNDVEEVQETVTETPSYSTTNNDQYVMDGWPEAGYVLEASEDLYFSTEDEAIAYAKDHGMDYVNKYNARNEWATFDTPNGILLRWYIYRG